MERSETMKLDDVLAASADGAFAIDPDGKIVFWNLAAEKILGYSAQEVMGRPCCELFGDVGGSAALCYRDCNVARSVKTGDPVHTFDVQIRTKAGNEIWVNISALTVSNGLAGRDVTVHLFHDVTAAKEIVAFIRERLVHPSRSPDGNGALTPRELEILKIIATGLSSKAAAEKLRVSPATVRNHVQSILTKLGVHSRLEAVACAIRHRLL